MSSPTEEFSVFCPTLISFIRSVCKSAFVLIQPDLMVDYQEFVTFLILLMPALLECLKESTLDYLVIVNGFVSLDCFHH